MATQLLFPIALVIHIIGFTMMAGTTLVDFIITRQFWKLYAIDKSRGMPVYEATAAMRKLFGTGILLLIVSGIAMMALTRGVFGDQTWFRIKMAIVVLIIINGLAAGRRNGTRVREFLLLESRGQNVDSKMPDVRSRLRRFHLIQLFFFLSVFVLSVFRFN